VEGKRKGTFDFQLAGEAYRSTEALTKVVRHLRYAERKAFNQWRGQCAKDLEELLSQEGRAHLVEQNLIRDQVEVTDGHVATGPLVASARSFTKWLKAKSDRTFLAVEMESAGFLMAAWEVVRSQHTLVLRGISDYGDTRKSKLDRIGEGGLRKYAMRNAIHFLWHLMEADVLPHAPEHSPGR
jgi:nucleoside phosphorylase